MSDKVSLEDFIKAFGNGVKENRKITPMKINCIRDHVFVRRAAHDTKEANNEDHD